MPRFGPQKIYHVTQTRITFFVTNKITKEISSLGFYYSQVAIEPKVPRSYVYS
jgi:hypothetical protein